MYKFAQGCLILAGILWGIELIPQLWKTYTTKSVKDISFSFFIMCFCAYLLYTIGNIILQNWLIVIAHIPSVILTSLMLILILKYRRNKL